MDLEFAVIDGVDEAQMEPEIYPFDVTDEVDRYRPSAIDWHRPNAVVDWAPMVRAVVDDVRQGVAVSTMATRIHNTLAAIIVDVAVRVGEPHVVLTGGCFQNRCLTERAVARLRDAGFRPYWHQRVPPNDGGLSLGQIAAVLRQV